MVYEAILIVVSACVCVSVSVRSINALTPILSLSVNAIFVVAVSASETGLIFIIASFVFVVVPSGNIFILIEEFYTMGLLVNLSENIF